jgi:hypothetical protein
VALAVRGFAAKANAAVGSTITLSAADFSTAPQSGDIILALVTGYDPGDIVTSITATATGLTWVQRDLFTFPASAPMGASFSIVLPSAYATTTFDMGLGNNLAGIGVVAVAISGSASGTIDARLITWNDGGGVATAVAPSVTAAGTSDLWTVLYGGGGGGAFTGTWGTPSPGVWTAAGSVNNGASARIATAAYTQALVGAGATGTATSTVSVGTHFGSLAWSVLILDGVGFTPNAQTNISTAAVQRAAAW